MLALEQSGLPLVAHGDEDVGEDVDMGVGVGVGDAPLVLMLFLRVTEVHGCQDERQNSNDILTTAPR